MINPGAHPHDCACGCGNAAFGQALERLVDDVLERNPLDPAPRERAERILRALRRDAEESEVVR